MGLPRRVGSKKNCSSKKHIEAKSHRFLRHYQSREDSGVREMPILNGKRQFAYQKSSEKFEKQAEERGIILHADNSSSHTTANLIIYAISERPKHSVDRSSTVQYSQLLASLAPNYSLFIPVNQD
ncbi:hypothetical protein TNCT_31981 [Trichonephila clavata]|uniref:Uncharacterized protein n=1 Tax=Trichonephila clavata TaxID=2740835 RepID=A0A8X6G903_TRICU|nr:hypothetical protein TNCT_31981 [Trichonephila clavata]